MKTAAIIFYLVLAILIYPHVSFSNYPTKSGEPIDYIYTNFSGESMTSFGFPGTPHLLKVYPNKPCEVGSFCVFECLVEKCFNDGQPAHSYLKKLISVTDGCYLFEGNPDPWEENGVVKYSFDSRYYGCLYPSEFSIVGVAFPDK